MGFKVRMAWALAFAPALVLSANTAFAAGGKVVLRTDNGADGYYYGLDGSGTARYIAEYLADSFDPGAIVCGFYWQELNQGTIPPPGIGGGDVRLEDTLNPGYPGLGAPELLATVDPASQGACAGATRRLFTFNSGAGIPDPVANHYYSAIEPIAGTAGIDFCGTRLDTNSPRQGWSKTYSGGTFGAIPWNHFVEAVVFTSNLVDLNMRASGSARFPGDKGIPVVYTTRANGIGSVSDDNITVTLTVDNKTLGPISRNLKVSVDKSAIPPAFLPGNKEITAFLRTIGGSNCHTSVTTIMNPVAFPVGRTVCRLEISQEGPKVKAAGVGNKVFNLPVRVLVDDPPLDTDPHRLNGITEIDDEIQKLGFRRRPGSQDDNETNVFFTVQAVNVLQDSLNVRNRAIDMPKIAYNITGFEVVGGEFGGSGLAGLDALELRSEDPVFAGESDLSAFGLLRSVGTPGGGADGIIFPGATPPIVKVFNTVDLAVTPTGNPALVNNLYLRALMQPGEGAITTAVGADSIPSDTILGNSSFTASGITPSRYTLNNNQLRLLVNGDRSTLEAESIPAVADSSAFHRTATREIPIDKKGNRIQE